MKKTKTLLFGFLATIFLISCDKDQDDFDNNFILLNFTANEDLTYQNPNFTLSLYGYNKTVADEMGTLINRNDYEAGEIPFEARLDIPPNPYAEIPNLESETDAVFYLEIEWDSDGNSQICQGDIDFNYNVQNVNLINIRRRDPQEIKLSTIPETSACTEEF